MTVYRYRFAGPPDLTDYVPASKTSTKVSAAAPLYTDIDAPVEAKADLDDFMSSIGWAFDSESPTNSPTDAVGPLVQSLMANVTTDQATTSTAFVDLLSISITAKGNNYLLIRAMGSVSNSLASANMRLRITVDGVSYGGCQTRSVAAAIGVPFGVAARVAVAPGVRTVKLQWATASGSMRVRPVSNVDAESAVLMVEEVVR